jgi:hypothetical protein
VLSDDPFGSCDPSWEQVKAFSEAAEAEHLDALRRGTADVDDREAAEQLVDRVERSSAMWARARASTGSTTSTSSRCGQSSRYLPCGGQWRVVLERLPPVTLVVGRVVGDQIRIVADSLLTQSDRRKGYFAGALKPVILHPGLCVAYAGGAEDGIRALRALGA